MLSTLLLTWSWQLFATITIDPWKPLFRGVDHTQGRADSAEVRLQKVFALRIDLKDPDVEFFTTPGNGAAEKETFGQTTTTFVSTYAVAVGVNANFFSPVSTIANEPRDLSGLAISEGTVVSPAESGRPMALISRSNTVSFTSTAPGQPAAWWAAVAGSHLVVQGGINTVSITCTTSFCGPNPRTALGITQDKRYLYMLVIDGRQPGWSDGATLVETGDWLLRFGAWDGLNLDGGGSSAMARLTNGTAVLINRPSGGVQRVNGNHIGVFASDKFTPVIEAQPASRVVREWDPVSFSVTATSIKTPLAYQWRLNSTNIPGATSPNYTISWAQRSDAGAYSVRVSNVDGETFSSNAILTVLASPSRIIARGDNSAGQLQTSPSLTNLLAIAAGDRHNLVLRSDRRALAWGANYYGQANVPQSASNLVGIAAGGDHCLAIDTHGKVFAWGADIFGQCRLPAGLGPAIAVAAGGLHSLAIERDGRVLAWGNSSFGQTNVPADLGNPVAIAAGAAHSLALDAHGNVFAWGSNTNGSGLYSGQATVPAGLSNVTRIAAGYWHNLAVLSNGTVRAWGDNSAGQTNVPTNLPPIAFVSAGRAYSMALADDGRLFCWGDNSYGQTNYPGVVTNFVCIAAGGQHSMALQKEDAIIAPQPFGPEVKPGSFSLLSPTFARSSYLFLKSPSLTSPWSLISTRKGNGGLVIFEDTAPTEGRAFYQIGSN